MITLLIILVLYFGMTVVTGVGWLILYVDTDPDTGDLVTAGLIGAFWPMMLPLGLLLQTIKYLHTLIKKGDK